MEPIILLHPRPQKIEAAFERVNRTESASIPFRTMQLSEIWSGDIITHLKEGRTILLDAASYLDDENPGKHLLALQIYATKNGGRLIVLYSDEGIRLELLSCGITSGLLCSESFLVEDPLEALRAYNVAF